MKGDKNMSEFKVFKSGDFTVMSNYHLKDSRLSLKAIGLLSKMLSLPDNWDYSLKGLVAICKESSDAIRAALDELKENNYIEIIRERTNKGTFKYNYLIFENPFEKALKTQNQPDMENPYTDNPYTVKPDMENPNQYNIKESNINNLKDNNDKSDKRKEHNILTLELIQLNYVTENDPTLILYDDFFKELISNGYTYKQLYSCVHYVASKVVSRDFLDEEGNNIKNKFGYFKNSINSNFAKFENRQHELYPEDENDPFWDDYFNEGR